MKKLICIVTMIVSLFADPITLNNEIQVIEDVKEEPVICVENVIEIEVQELKPIKEVRQEEFDKKLAKIESLKEESKLEWFQAYKKLLVKYKKWIDEPATLYDTFSEKELELLFGVVQAEVGDEWEFENKVNVASVIFNRLYSEKDNFKYQDTLSKVLTKKEFSSISDGRYKKVEVSEVTILACEYAFMIEDTTDGCMAFRSDRGAPNKWCKWNKIFFDDAHYFYK